MNATTLALPVRTAQPRAWGWTILIDNGVPLRYFEDAIESACAYVDLVKFGWGTALVSDHLARKIACLQQRGIGYFFGGTLFEKYYSQHQVSAYAAYCQEHGCQYVEISNGTIPLSTREKGRIITDFAQDFAVLSEVGSKDSQVSERISPAMWIEALRDDLAAGATKAITEARESGTSGICRADGQLRYSVIEAMLASGLEPRDLIFEAPTKALQSYFIRRLGANVNLANIAFTDAIGVETLRLGLRSDTLLAFDEAEWEQGDSRHAG